MPHISQIIRQPAAARRALVAILTTLCWAAACDEPPDWLPTGPSIPNRTSPGAGVVGANVTVLPTLGGVSTTPVDINDISQVVGSSSTGQANHAFLWALAGGMRDLGTLGGLHSFATAINNAGQVVGFSELEVGVATHAFLWTPAKGMEDLGTLGGTYSSARLIDDNGRVIGVSWNASGATRMFLWTRDRGMQDLTATTDVPGIIDVNNAGQMAGTASFNGEDHAFLWTPGEGIRDLGSLDGDRTSASALNEAGWVVGYTNSIAPTRPFLWTPRDGMRDLGVSGGVLPSSATDVNDLGQVVGYITTPPSKRHAFLWTETDGLEDIYPVTGMASIAAINNRGEVVGDGRFAALQFRFPNHAPVVNMGGPYAGTEGTPVAFALSATDADGDPLTFSWDLGDGTTGSGPTPPTSHTYADDGTYLVRLSVSDGKLGTDVKTTLATIANVGPTIPAGGLTGPTSAIRLMGGSVSAPVTLAFTDAAGPNDTYTTQVACGNGTTRTGSRIISPYVTTCTYTSAGIYTVTATVSDEDGGVSVPASYRSVVVFDPEGGSVTAGAFYDIPGQGDRKAHFTFSAAFLPGQATAPNGMVKFWIPDRELDFESKALEMLVVSGNRAQFWGTGTLNGAPAWFRITAVDGGPGQGAVRIELWNAAGTSLLYDTQPGAPQDAPVSTTIEGGNIQVH